MRTQIQADPAVDSPKAPRFQRGAAAVIAQYIQELTHIQHISSPREPVPCVSCP